MERLGHLAMAIMVLATSLPSPPARAETNSLLAVSLRTFPSDHMARRAMPAREPRARTGRVLHSTGKPAATTMRPAAVKAVATHPSAPVPATPAQVAPGLPNPASSAAPGVTARVPQEVLPAVTPTKTAELGAVSSRTVSLAAAPRSRASPADAAPPPSCKRFVPAAGVMVDVPCER